MKKLEEMTWHELQEVIRDADDDTFDAAWDRRTIIEIEWLNTLRDSLDPGTFEHSVIDDAAYRAQAALDEHRFDIELKRNWRSAEQNPHKLGCDCPPPDGGA